MSDRKRILAASIPAFDRAHFAPRDEPSARRLSAFGRRLGPRTRWLQRAVLLALFVWPSPPSLHAQDTASNPASDSGVFLILSENHRVGTEKFQIKRSPSGWDATGELQLEGPKNAKVSESATFHLDAALRPAKYERVQNTPVAGNLAVVFGPEETQLAAVVDGGEPQQEEFVLPLDNLVVLDTNFFHHYTFLLRLYDRARGGAQPFNVFIPQEALPGTISLKYIAKESVPIGQSTKQLDHFQAVTEELQIEIWATPEGAMQRISIPAAKLEVVRQ